MTKTEIAKKIANVVVGFGTTCIVHAIVQNNTNTETVSRKVAVFSSSCVIGFMAVDATTEYTETKIDEIVAWWKTNVK